MYFFPPFSRKLAVFTANRNFTAGAAANVHNRAPLAIAHVLLPFAAAVIV